MFRLFFTAAALLASAPTFAEEPAAFAVEQTCQVHFIAGEDIGFHSFSPAVAEDCSEDGALRELYQRGVQDSQNIKIKITGVKLLTGSRQLGQKEIDDNLRDCFQRQQAEVAAALPKIEALKQDANMVRLYGSLQVNSGVTYKVLVGDARGSQVLIDNERLAITTGANGLVVLLKPRVTKYECQLITASEIVAETINQARLTLEQRAKLGLARL